MPSPKILRVFFGFIIVVVFLVAAFSLAINPWVHYMGASEEEIAATYPGDEILANPIVDWTHAVTIDAPPEQVWPWIAQLGDRKGGFYSYTWIENIVAGEKIYNNANAILTEYQDPQPGDSIIGSALALREVKTGQYLLADTVSDMGWTWLWQIAPDDDGKTRLVVRMAIEPPSGVSNPVLTWVMNAGGFIMERNMFLGIEERAEGRTEPASIEINEAVIWGITLLVGFYAAGLFIARKAWLQPLVVGLAAVTVLLVITFYQPPIFARVILDMALLAGAWWANLSSRLSALRRVSSAAAAA